MKKEYLNEKISHNRDIKNNLWTALIITISGTIGLSLNPDNIYKIILVLIGVLLTAVFLNAYLKRYTTIEDLILNLKKED